MPDIFGIFTEMMNYFGYRAQEGPGYSNKNMRLDDFLPCLLVHRFGSHDINYNYSYLVFLIRNSSTGFLNGS